MNTNENEKLITRKEAKKLLHIRADATIWRMYRSGKLPMYRCGRRILFKESEILAAIHIPATE